MSSAQFLSPEDQEIIKKYGAGVDMTYHMQNKSMWGGKPEAQYQNAIYFVENKHNPEMKYRIAQGILLYSTAWFKTIDELIVNAADRCINGQANDIEVYFDGITFTVKNNGPGFEIAKHPTQGIYIPEYLITCPFTGTEIVKNEESITGGTNGVGIKFVCANSEILGIITVDPRRRLAYIQSFSELKPMSQPLIIPLHGPTPYQGYTLSAENPFTLFSYKPKLSVFSMDTQRVDKNFLVSMINVRVHQIAAYCNTRVRTTDPARRVSVKYNGEPVKISSLLDYVRMDMEPEDKVVRGTVNAPGNKFPWDVCVVIQNMASKSKKDDPSKHMSFVNGVTATGGGHIQHIYKQICDRVMEAFKSERFLHASDEDEKKSRSEMIKTLVQNSFRIYISGAIPKPNWDAQGKANITDAPSRFADYRIPDDMIKEIVGYLQKVINAAIYHEEKKAIDKILKEDIDVSPKEHCRATFARPGIAPNPHKPRRLYLTEGSSASQFVKNMLSQLKFGFDYNGVFDGRGVPMNARKQVREFYDEKGKVQYLMTRKLSENRTLKKLVKILNLSYDLKYETAAERATLYYDEIIISTDQDVDGVGKISTLFQSFFELFWPGLFKAGIIKQLQTPQIIVTPAKSKKIEHIFFYEYDFNAWYNSLPERERSKWRAIYCKGLGRMEDTSFVKLFSNLEEKILTIRYDPDTRVMFDLFYNDETELRKIWFSTPLEEKPPAPQSNAVYASDFVQYNAKLYAMDNILRMLPNVYDGLFVSWRKVLATLIHSRYDDETKINTIAGDTTRLMGYRHGEGSLASTVVSMAIYHSAGRPVPLIVPRGQLGVRGSPEGADPRYTCAELWKDLIDNMFPREDDDFLVYDTEEGKTHEPRFYVSMDCFSVLDYRNNPASGWNIRCFPRAHRERLYNIRQMIAHGPDVPFIPMPINLNGFRGKYIRTETGEEYMQGNYQVYPDRRTVIITELPNTISVEGYINSLSALVDYIIPPKVKKRELTDDYITNHSTADINIKITFLPGALDYLYNNSSPPHPDIDRLAFKLGLVDKINHSLNMINERKLVSTFTNYEQPMRLWFKMRTHIWKLRQERTILRLRARIIVLENQIRFCNEQKKYNMDKMSEDEAITFLENNGYKKINYQILAQRSCRMTNEEYRRRVYDEGDYNYLLELTYRQLLAAANQRREKELAEYRTELELYEKDPEYYKQLWLRHLDVLEKIYANRDMLIASHCIH